MTQPLVVAYGAGLDSTAMLVGMQQRGIRPDLILFADTGAEKPETYAYLDTMDAWLSRHGMPQITRLVYTLTRPTKNCPTYGTLFENCLSNGTLPSEAFGFGSCSIKWKQQPQEKYLKGWDPAVQAWAQGLKVVRAVGYDCSEEKRSFKAAKQISKAYANRYQDWYPLQDWKWDRDTCAAQIQAAGLPVPVKSSCYFCPNMRPAEIDQLQPELLARIVILEARAKPRLEKIQGLWRNGNKGLKNPANKRPGRITDYIRERGLLDPETVDKLELETPKELRLRDLEWQQIADERGQVTADSWVQAWEPFIANLVETALDK